MVQPQKSRRVDSALGGQRFTASHRETSNSDVFKVSSSCFFVIFYLCWIKFSLLFRQSIVQMLSSYCFTVEFVSQCEQRECVMISVCVSGQLLVLTVHRPCNNQCSLFWLCNYQCSLVWPCNNQCSPSGRMISVHCLAMYVHMSDHINMFTVWPCNKQCLLSGHVIVFTCPPL